MKKTEKNASLVIGLTGLYCAGKNYIAGLFEKQEIPVLDVDKLGYEVIDKEKVRLTGLFGGDILGKDGKIDRKLLGKKVFGKAAELAALENIIHPAVNRETNEWIAGCKKKACVINAALLHRSSAFEKLDAIILVEAPFLTRLFRARKRDKLPWATIIKRFRSQKNFHSQYLNAKADIYRVGNSGIGFFGPKKKPESRINEILSRLVDD